LRVFNRNARALDKDGVPDLVALSNDVTTVQAGCRQLREALLQALAPG